MKIKMEAYLQQEQEDQDIHPGLFKETTLKVRRPDPDDTDTEYVIELPNGDWILIALSQGSNEEF